MRNELFQHNGKKVFHHSYLQDLKLKWLEDAENAALGANRIDKATSKYILEVVLS